MTILREVRRVLRSDGCCFVNIGDTFICGQGPPIEGLKPKDRVGIPHMLAFALRDDGWYWRDEIIWHKQTPTPEPVQDRTTKAHEHVFMFTRSQRYQYHPNGAGSVWTLSHEPFNDKHFAVMPTELAKRCLLAASTEACVVLDPLAGVGTTGVVARRLNCRFIGLELNPEYVEMARQRIAAEDRPPVACLAMVAVAKLKSGSFRVSGPQQRTFAISANQAKILVALDAGNCPRTSLYGSCEPTQPKQAAHEKYHCKMSIKRLFHRGLLEWRRGDPALTEFGRLVAAEVEGQEVVPCFQTELGTLYRGDCLDLLPTRQDGIADLVFCDPPFNLRKNYGDRVRDQRPDYLEWCAHWLAECVRVLAPGGSLFIYSLPRWSMTIGHNLLRQGLTFRHWIAVEQCSRLPIPDQLYPAHYALVYFTKGRPKTFRRIRTPIATCRHCGGEIKKYGGHRSKMNPNGATLKDVWTDVPPVRHPQYKSKRRRANALSTRILERVIEMSTRPGDLVLDPFLGSGTTAAVCDAKGRRWIGIELGSCEAAIERLTSDSVQLQRTNDYVEV